MVEITDLLVGTLAFLISFTILRWINGVNKDGHRRRPYPPSLPALPVVGSFPFLGSIEQLPEYFLNATEKLGPIFSFYSGRKLAVVLNGKDLIVEALVKNSVDFADRPPIFTEIYGTNVNLKGMGFKPYNESFKKYHRLSLSILREFGFGVRDVSEARILEEVEGLLDEIKRKNGQSFNPKSMVTTAVSNVVLAILFGRKFLQTGTTLHTDLAESVSKHMASMDPAFDIAPFIRFLPNYRRKLIASAEAHVALRKCISDAVRNSLEDEELNFVKRFVEIEGRDYDSEELLFILRDFCGGAVDTVAMTILWAMVYLANNPEIQDRLHGEIDAVISSRDGLPSLDDKRHLPFTEAVILETMRIKTLVPLAAPHAVSRDKELNGYFIPKGTMVMVNLYSVHMDRKVWRDPAVFRPERFLDEDNKVFGGERIIPFSLGKRSCPGEDLGRKKLFLFLTSLVRHFDIRPPEGHDSIVVFDVCGLTVVPSAFDVRLVPRSTTLNFPLNT